MSADFGYAFCIYKKIWTDFFFRIVLNYQASYTLVKLARQHALHCDVVDDEPRIYFRAHFVARRIAGAYTEDESRRHCSAGRGDIQHESFPAVSLSIRLHVRVCVRSVCMWNNASHARVHTACNRLASDACTRRIFCKLFYVFREWCQPLVQPRLQLPSLYSQSLFYTPSILRARVSYNY